MTISPAHLFMGNAECPFRLDLNQPPTPVGGIPRLWRAWSVTFNKVQHKETFRCECLLLEVEENGAVGFDRDSVEGNGFKLESASGGFGGACEHTRTGRG